MNLQERLAEKINTKTKPIGALGVLETIALQIGLVQQTENPTINNPQIVVFAADHGIATTGLVNPFPQAVTAQMVLNFIAGGAAINIFTKQNNIGLTVVDCGVNFAFKDFLFNTQFLNRKVAFGTKNYQVEDALTKEEVDNAVENGKTIVAGIHTNTIGFGEMGISNTSSAALIMSAILQIPIVECVGRGTGVNDEQLQQKQQVLEQVFTNHKLQNLSDKPLELLQKVGGLEIATMVGAYLQAAEQKMVIVVDGFITTASLLIALQLNNNILQNCIFAHASGEQGHTKMLNHLKVKPLLHLGLRLGEGTGAALAIPLLQSACLFVKEMASFKSAKVSTAN